MLQGGHPKDKETRQKEDTKEAESNDDWRSHHHSQKGRKKVSFSHINIEKPHGEKDFFRGGAFFLKPISNLRTSSFLERLDSCPLRTKHNISKNSLPRYFQKSIHSDSVMPIAQSLCLNPVFIIHNLINEHNGGCRHYSLSQTTLKNILHIYYYSLLVDVNNLISQYLVFIIPYYLPQIHLIFSLLHLLTIV